MGDTRRTYSVHSVQRALMILKVLARRPRLTLSQIAKEIGAPRTTALMILSTMQQEKFIDRLEDSTYQLGGGLYDILFSSPFIDTLCATAAPFLAELSEQTGLTVHMAVQEGTDSVYVAKVDGRGMVKFNTYVGQRHALYLTGVGKAILMQTSDDDILGLFPQPSFAEITPKTIRTPGELLEHIRQARQRGYAVEDEEAEMGVSCLGVPIVDLRGVTIGSISVTGLTNQLSLDIHESVAKKMKNTADKIAYALSLKQSESDRA